MILLLDRKYLKETYTIGHLYVDGVYFCDTIEDKVRDPNQDGELQAEEKVYGKTAIPYGRYQVILTDSPKFKRELPLVLDVPHFTGIRIHRGNTAEDSHGCILPGENKLEGKVINSGKYEKMIIQMMKLATQGGQDVTLEIK